MPHEIPEKLELDRLADESGLAIALIDESSHEIYVANNNSICRNLNPDGKFIGQCAAFCGTAFDEAAEVGAVVSYTCHAGLECKAVPNNDASHPLVVIVGRTFLKADNYRKATERSISGDWSQYPPAEFFENILLTGSASLLDKTAEEVKSLLPIYESRLGELPAEPPEAPEAPENFEVTRVEDVLPEPALEAVTAEPVAKKPSDVLPTIVERFNREVGLKTKSTKQEVKAETQPQTVSVEVPVAEADTTLKAKAKEKRIAEARAWRSFFGSLLKTDYLQARDSILDFLASQYGFSALIWLEKSEGRLENTATFGEMKGRKIKLGIASNDKRLIAAWKNELPLELSERAKDESTTGRMMFLFPIGVGGDISAGIAILDQIVDEIVKKQIARICHSVAPQLEILRLRSEVARGETLSTAVRRFSESLKRIDADDLWLNLTQNAAEMLRAERASLLIYDEKNEILEIKAMIGAKGQPGDDEEAGLRVAKVVFKKNRPIIVPDVSKTGLSPAQADRQYKTPSFLSCPISIGSRTIGVMSFADKASGLPFDRSSLYLFQAIAPQLAIAIDRASLKEKAGEFEQLSVTDALTGLLNRRYIEARLMEEVKRSNRHGFPMSFMMVDVDHFKTYNDQFGHPAGDEALKLVASVIRDTLRGADVAARFGGEEFSILLPQTKGEEAAAIAERIRSNIAGAKFPHRKVTVSIGIASCSADLCSSATLVSAADKALYAAKHQGRDRVLAFEEMNVETAT